MGVQIVRAGGQANNVIARRRGYARALHRVWNGRAHVRSVLVVLLGSRWAPKVGWLLSFLILAIGAAGTFGILKGEWAMAGFIVLVGFNEGWSVMVRGQSIVALQNEFKRLAPVVSGMAGRRAFGNEVESLLRRARDIVGSIVKAPTGDTLTAHLLEPEKLQDGETVLRATRHDDTTMRVHGPIQLDAPGAPQAYLTGKPVAVPYTEDYEHGRIRGRDYKSIAAFPIIIGEPGDDPRVAGVVSVDSTHPHTFSQKAVERHIEPLVAPIVQLIGLAVELSKEERDGR